MNLPATLQLPSFPRLSNDARHLHCSWTLHTPPPLQSEVDLGRLHLSSALSGVVGVVDGSGLDSLGDVVKEFIQAAQEIMLAQGLPSSVHPSGSSGGTLPTCLLLVADAGEALLEMHASRAALDPSGGQGLHVEFITLEGRDEEAISMHLEMVAGRLLSASLVVLDADAAAAASAAATGGGGGKRGGIGGSPSQQDLSSAATAAAAIASEAIPGSPIKEDLSGVGDGGEMGLGMGGGVAGASARKSMKSPVKLGGLIGSLPSTPSFSLRSSTLAAPFSPLLHTFGSDTAVDAGLSAMGSVLLGHRGLRVTGRLYRRRGDVACLAASPHDALAMYSKAGVCCKSSSDTLLAPLLAEGRAVAQLLVWCVDNEEAVHAAPYLSPVAEALEEARVGWGVACDTPHVLAAFAGVRAGYVQATLRLASYLLKHPVIPKGLGWDSSSSGSSSIGSADASNAWIKLTMEYPTHLKEALAWRRTQSQQQEQPESQDESGVEGPKSSSWPIPWRLEPQASWELWESTQQVGGVGVKGLVLAEAAAAVAWASQAWSTGLQGIRGSIGKMQGTTGGGVGQSLSTKRLPSGGGGGEGEGGGGELPTPPAPISSSPAPPIRSKSVMFPKSILLDPSEARASSSSVKTRGESSGSAPSVPSTTNPSLATGFLAATAAASSNSVLMRAREEPLAVVLFLLNTALATCPLVTPIPSRVHCLLWGARVALSSGVFRRKGEVMMTQAARLLRGMQNTLPGSVSSTTSSGSGGGGGGGGSSSVDGGVGVWGGWDEGGVLDSSGSVIGGAESTGGEGGAGRERFHSAFSTPNTPKQHHPPQSRTPLSPPSLYSAIHSIQPIVLPHRALPAATPTPSSSTTTTSREEEGAGAMVVAGVGVGVGVTTRPLSNDLASWPWPWVMSNCTSATVTLPFPLRSSPPSAISASLCLSLLLTPPSKAPTSSAPCFSGLKPSAMLRDTVGDFWQAGDVLGAASALGLGIALEWWHPRDYSPEVLTGKERRGAPSKAALSHLLSLPPSTTCHLTRAQYSPSAATHTLPTPRTTTAASPPPPTTTTNSSSTLTHPPLSSAGASVFQAFIGHGKDNGLGTAMWHSRAMTRAVYGGSQGDQGNGAAAPKHLPPPPLVLLSVLLEGGTLGPCVTSSSLEGALSTLQAGLEVCEAIGEEIVEREGGGRTQVPPTTTSTSTTTPAPTPTPSPLELLTALALSHPSQGGAKEASLGALKWMVGGGWCRGAQRNQGVGKVLWPAGEFLTSLLTLVAGELELEDVGGEGVSNTSSPSITSYQAAAAGGGSGGGVGGGVGTSSFSPYPQLESEGLVELHVLHSIATPIVYGTSWSSM